MPRGGFRAGAGRPRLADRVGDVERPQKPPTPGQLSRRRHLEDLYAFFSASSQRLMAGPQNVVVWREARYQAGVLVQLDAALSRLERIEADSQGPVEEVG
jgi:hypothetical protein